MTRSDRWIGTLFFLFGLFVVWQASKLEFASSYGAGSGFFPYWLGIATIVLAAVVGISAWRKSSGADSTTAPHLSKEKIAAFLKDQGAPPNFNAAMLLPIAFVRWVRRIRPAKAGMKRSEDRIPPRFLNNTLHYLLVRPACCNFSPAPIGVSLLVVLQRTAD